MAKFIIIRGQRDFGKTTNAGLVYSELLKISETKHRFNGKDVESNSLEYKKDSDELFDFSAILTINGKKIGISSAGDVPTELERIINNFINKGIEIIICCSRSRNVRGSSYRMIIDKFSKNNKILKEIWVSHSVNKADKESIKKNSVSEIIKIVNDNVS
jgi:hypothetical protein